jgi:hypothetical protein
MLPYVSSYVKRDLEYVKRDLNMCGAALTSPWPACLLLLRRSGVREHIRQTKEKMPQEAYERGLYRIPAPTPKAAAAVCFSAAQRATLATQSFFHPLLRLVH